MILTELLEDRHHHLPDSVAPLRPDFDRLVEQPLERPLEVALGERPEDLRELPACRELLEELL